MQESPRSPRASGGSFISGGHVAGPALAGSLNNEDFSENKWLNGHVQGQA